MRHIVQIEGGTEAAAYGPARAAQKSAKQASKLAHVRATARAAQAALFSALESVAALIASAAEAALPPAAEAATAGDKAASSSAGIIATTLSRASSPEMTALVALAVAPACGSWGTCFPDSCAAILVVPETAASVSASSCVMQRK